MSAPDNIKRLSAAMLPDETLEQAACRFLQERGDHEYARSALEESEDQYRREAKELKAERDRLKGETRRLKREVRRLSYAVENKQVELDRAHNHLRHWENQAELENVMAPADSNADYRRQCIELEAHVERFRNAIDYSGAHKDCQQLSDVIRETPRQSLAAVRAETLEALADEYYGPIEPETIRHRAQQLRGETDNE